MLAENTAKKREKSALSVAISADGVKKVKSC